MCPRIDKTNQQQISWKMFYWFVLYVSITKLTKIFKHFSTWVTMDMISINFYSISDTMCLTHRLDIPQCWDVNIFISIHNTFALSNVSHPMQNLYKICERNNFFISHTTTLKLRKTRNMSKILYHRIQFSLMTSFFLCWWFYFCLLDHLEWKTLSALDMSNLRFAKAWHPQKITSDQKIVTP